LLLYIRQQAGGTPDYLHPDILFDRKDPNFTNFHYHPSSNAAANFHSCIIYIDFDTDSHCTNSNGYNHSV
jgi:hypothetical protein